MWRWASSSWHSPVSRSCWSGAWALFLLGAALPFEGLLTPGFFASGIKALALVTFSSIGFRLLLDRRLYAKLWHLLQQPLVLTLLALVCWSTVSISWATNQDAALVKTSTFLGLFGLVLTIGLLKERELNVVVGNRSLRYAPVNSPWLRAVRAPRNSCQWPVLVGRPGSKRLCGDSW